MLVDDILRYSYTFHLPRILSSCLTNQRSSSPQCFASANSSWHRGKTLAESRLGVSCPGSRRLTGQSVTICLLGGLCREEGSNPYRISPHCHLAVCQHTATRPGSVREGVGASVTQAGPRQTDIASICATTTISEVSEASSPFIDHGSLNSSVSSTGHTCMSSVETTVRG